MTYDSVGPVQLSFLRMLSLEATQNFTYTCLNSVAWYDNDNRGYEKSLKLLGDNDDEFSAMHNKPNVIEDGCRVKIPHFILHFSTKCRYKTYDFDTRFETKDLKNQSLKSGFRFSQNFTLENTNNKLPYHITVFFEFSI